MKFHIVTKVSADTSQEAWSKLNSILCAACERKQEIGHEWPQWISTNDGQIECTSDFVKVSTEEKLERALKVAHQLSTELTMLATIGKFKGLVKRGTIMKPAQAFAKDALDAYESLLCDLTGTHPTNPPKTK